MDDDDDEDDDFAAGSCTAPSLIFLKCHQFPINLKIGLSRLPEVRSKVQKKGKSSKFNPRNDGQVNSSPSLKAWLYEGSNLYPKITFDIFSEIAQQMLAKFGN